MKKIVESGIRFTSFTDPSEVGGAPNVSIFTRDTSPHIPNINQLAACCFIQRPSDDKILAVSRKYDKNQFGLPGGKVEPHESIEAAAKRELFEECGLTASALKEVYVDVDSGEFETHTFICDVENLDNMRTSEEGRIAWVTWNVLLNGPFGEYNRKLQATLGQS